MGATSSNTLEPVTMNRFRDVCQRTKNSENKRWRVEALANDIQKLTGIHIPVVTSSGKPIKLGTVCSKIKNVIPHPESVCMLSTRQGGIKNILSMVNTFNNTYNSNISVYKNPLDPKSGYRSMENLCDDLYYVAGQIDRDLADHTKLIKQSLVDEVQNLNNMTEILNNYQSALQSNIKNSVDPDKNEQELLRLQALNKGAQQVLSSYSNKLNKLTQSGPMTDLQLIQNQNSIQDIIDQKNQIESEQATKLKDEFGLQDPAQAIVALNNQLTAHVALVYGSLIDLSKRSINAFDKFYSGHSTQINELMSEIKKLRSEEFDRVDASGKEKFLLDTEAILSYLSLSESDPTLRQKVKKEGRGNECTDNEEVAQNNPKTCQGQYGGSGFGTLYRTAIDSIEQMAEDSTELIGGGRRPRKSSRSRKSRSKSRKSRSRKSRSRKSRSRKSRSKSKKSKSKSKSKKSSSKRRRRRSRV